MNPGLRHLLLCILLLIASGFSSPLWADPTTCTISDTGVAFGNYDPTIGTANASLGSINVTCTPGCALPIIIVCLGYNGLASTITLSASATNGSYSPRQLLGSGGQLLAYNLYLDINHTTIFGNGSSGTSDVTYCFTGANVSSCSGATYTGSPAGPNSQSQSVPVYGLLPAGQNVSAGAYTDTLTATITF
jgi:spore coat protein U-like protein